MFFFEIEKLFFVFLVKLGDDVVLSDFVCFFFCGDVGLYIYFDIWYEGVFVING